MLLKLPHILPLKHGALKSAKSLIRSVWSRAYADWGFWPLQYCNSSLPLEMNDTFSYS